MTIILTRLKIQETATKTEAKIATTIVAAAENNTVHGGGERGAQFVADHA